MTLVHLIRKYKRWNPVHPTYGAFWGVGLGFGCGVGWGPGFGPEVVGFVGSGCGVGFNVGVMLIGIGVGLPASGLSSVPWNALLWTGKGASSITSNVMFPALVSTATQSWDALSLQASALDKGIQNLYTTQRPRSNKFVLESWRRFSRQVQGLHRNAVTRDSNVVEPRTPNGLEPRGDPPKPQTVSMTPQSQQKASSKPK